MTEADLRQILLEGTRLVMDAVARRITIPAFIHAYGNFYYYNALDGHESPPDEKGLLDHYGAVIRLHADVQQKVVDITYLGDPSLRQEYLLAGRIDQDEALTKLDQLATAHHATALLAALAQGPRTPTS